MSLLEISHVDISYGKRVTVKDSDITLEKGEICSIVGESGSGKTTVIRAVLGLLAGGGKVTAGDIVYEGRSLLSLSDKDWRALRGHDISMIFQDSGAMMNQTRLIGNTYVEYIRTHENISKKEAWAKGAEMLGRMRLPDPDRIMRSYPFQLSGGQRQRVGIAMGMTYQLAIDYDTICHSNTIGDLYTPGFSILPSGMGYGYETLNNPWKYDPEGAKALLDKAGIVDTNGNGIRELDGQDIYLRYVSYENRLLNDFSDAHTQYLSKVGIGVKSDYGSSDDQWTKLVAGEYDLNNNNWNHLIAGSPYTYLGNWCSENEADYCFYHNEEYNKLYKQLENEIDPDVRLDLLKKMQQILIDDGVAIVDGYYNSCMVWNSKTVATAHIRPNDYYWVTTEITPVG